MSMDDIPNAVWALGALVLALSALSVRRVSLGLLIRSLGGVRTSRLLGRG